MAKSEFKEAFYDLIERMIMDTRDLELQLESAGKVIAEISAAHPELDLQAKLIQARDSDEVKRRIRDRFDIPLETFRAARQHPSGVEPLSLALQMMQSKQSH